MRRQLLWFAAVAGLVVALPAAAQVKVDPKLPKYTPTTGVSGRIKSEGSDTMNNEMTLWGEGFTKIYPNVQIEIQGKGSTTAPPALIAGTSSFGPMSREMKNKEIDDFKEKYGYAPTALPTSIDVLAVYVHKDNPIKELTLEQADAIFSKTRKRGHKEVTTWGDLGLEGEWANKPISIYGRNAASGTYGYFKEHTLSNGDFKADVKEQPGSSAVVQGVASDKYAIGYSGIGYKTADVKAVPLAEKAGKKAFEASAENGYSGDYPLSRFLYIYVNYKPGTDLDPVRREFVRYIFSQEGQEEVVKCGYLPIRNILATKALKSVGIE